MSVFCDWPRTQDWAVAQHSMICSLSHISHLSHLSRLSPFSHLSLFSHLSPLSPLSLLSHLFHLFHLSPLSHSSGHESRIQNMLQARFLFRGAGRPPCDCTSFHPTLGLSRNVGTARKVSGAPKAMRQGAFRLQSKHMPSIGSVRLPHARAGPAYRPETNPAVLRSKGEKTTCCPIEAVGCAPANILRSRRGGWEDCRERRRDHCTYDHQTYGPWAFPPTQGANPNKPHGRASEA